MRGTLVLYSILSIISIHMDIGQIVEANFISVNKISNRNK